MGEAKRRAEQALISVLIPERGRPEQLDRLISSLLDTAGTDERVEILVMIDDDDPAWTDREPRQHSRTRYLRRPRPVTLGEKLNILARESAGEIMFFIANDYVMETPGWPMRFRVAVAGLPNGIGVPFVRDELHFQHAAFWLMTRRMMNEIGFFAAPWFPYWFVDTWIDQIGDMLGLKTEIDVTVSAPEGRGKTHGLVDLPFWVDFFQSTHPMRVRDAVRLSYVAWEDGTPQHKRFLEELAPRGDFCIKRVEHLSDPDFLAQWSGKSDSEPSPSYAYVRDHAERMLEKLRSEQPRRPRVTVCVPSGDTWKGTTAAAAMAMVSYSTQHGVLCSVLNVQTSIVSHARNSTVKLALESGCDYLMFLDSDMKFPPDTLIRLLKHDKMIVGATYNKKTPGKDGKYETLGRMKGERPAVIGDGIVEAHMMPGGVMLVKADVYRRMHWPWYAECYRWSGADGLEAFKHMLRDYFAEIPPMSVITELEDSQLGAWIKDNYAIDKGDDSIPMISEDYFFCRKATRHGIPVFCDLGLTYEISHIGAIEVTTLKPTSEPPADHD